MMLNYNGIQFETVHGFKIYPFPTKKHIFVLGLNSPKMTEKGKMHHDFFLVNDHTGETVYMFGCAVVDGYEAVELAEANAVEYIPLCWLKEAEI